MADVGFEFSSPDQRLSTVFLQHTAGFEVSDVNGDITFITAADLEKDADANPVSLRDVLKSEYEEVAGLSGEYLLRNLVIPNFPVGFYGDESGPPVILGTNIVVKAPATPSELEYSKSKYSTVSMGFTPTLGRLTNVACARQPRLGISNIDWFNAGRESCSVSLFGGLLKATILYDQNE